MSGCGGASSSRQAPTPTPESRLDPFASAHLRRAEIKIGSGSPHDALTDLDEALRLAPDLGPAWRLAGRAHYLLADYPAAIDAFLKAQKLLGPDPELLYLLAESYLQSRRFGPAEIVLRELAAMHPPHKIATKRLGLLYVSNGELDKAEPALRAALAELPDDLDVRLQLGALLRKRGKLDAAKAVLEEARRVQPKSAVAAYELGLALRQAGDSAAALSAFAAAVELDSWHEGALNQLQQLARAAGDTAAAGRWLEAFRVAQQAAGDRRSLEGELEHQPGRVDLLMKLALHDATHGHIDDAEPIFARALLIEPANHSAARNLGLARRRLGRAAEAVPAFQRAVELAPEDPIGRVELADALLASGDTDGARREIEEAATRTAAGDAGQQFLLAQIEERAGLLARSEEAYTRALATGAEDANALAGRGLVRVRLARTVEAMADLRRALELGTAREAEVRATLAQLSR